MSDEYFRKAGGNAMNYPNLKEAEPYFCLAYFAHVTGELMQEVLNGNEELTAMEAFNICKYTGIPYSVLFNRNLITLNRDNHRHWAMMEGLSQNLYEIWEWQKKGSHEADIYMKYQRGHFVNMDLDFRNRRPVAYCRYLGVKHEMEDALLFIRVEQDKIHNKPRGLCGGEKSNEA